MDEENNTNKEKGLRIREKFRESAMYLAAGAVFLAGAIGLGFGLHASGRSTELREQYEQFKQKHALLLEERADVSGKYTEVLEKNKDLLRERNKLEQQYSQLVQDCNDAQKNLSEDLGDLTGKLAKVTGDYDNAVRQKGQLEAKQQELTAKLNGLTKDYNAVTGEKKQIEERVKGVTKQLDGVTTNLNSANEKYGQLTAEKNKLEKEKAQALAQANDALKKYNDLLTKEKEPKSVRGADLGDETVGEIGLPLHQARTFRGTHGLEIVFFNKDLGDIDKAKTGFYEIAGESEGYTDKELRDRMLKGNYGFLFDVDEDGIRDIIYDGGEVGEDKLKKGEKDGSYAPAKMISNEVSNDVLRTYVLKGLGFE